MNQTTEVILVNLQDEPVGVMEKMEAHREPHLHRAFSIFLFDDQNRMLLQQRAFSKYHSGGLWTNTCCSHPFPGEAVDAAAARRLQEELGVSADMRKAFHFVYQAAFDNGLFEHEFDHVFIGHAPAASEIQPDPDEVEAIAFKSIETIKNDLSTGSCAYTEWFKIALPLLEDYLNRQPWSAPAAV